MNLSRIFTIVLLILYLNFQNMMLIGLSSLTNSYILFTFRIIRTSSNFSNLSQHTLVLELLNLQRMRLLFQVTLHPYLIKQLQVHKLRWEYLRIHPLIYHHLLPPHILRISAHICTVNRMVTMKRYRLILHPLVPFILWMMSCCVHLFWILLLMFIRIKLWMEFVFSSQLAISFTMIMCGSP